MVVKDRIDEAEAGKESSNWLPIQKTVDRKQTLVADKKYFKLLNFMVPEFEMFTAPSTQTQIYLTCLRDWLGLPRVPQDPPHLASRLLNGRWKRHPANQSLGQGSDHGSFLSLQL